VQNLTNLALVSFKRDKNQECLDWCKEALEIDHRNVKAMFWKGRATAEEADYDDAI